MQEPPDLVLQDILHHHQANTLEATARRTRTSTDEHTNAQNDPCDVMPLRRVVVENACRGDERSDLEQAHAQRIEELIIVVENENQHDDGGGDNHDKQIEPELGIVVELPETPFEQRGIEQRETRAREEHKGDGRIVDVGIVEIARAGIVGRETARRRGGHRVVQTVEKPHSCYIVTRRTSRRQQQIDAPYPLGRSAEPGMHLRAYRAGCLGCEDAHIAANHRGEQCYGEEHDSKSTDPLRH